MLPIYIDIDGTLTDLPEATGGNAIPERIEAVKKIIETGHYDVVLWSSGGTKYAQAFADKHDLKVYAALGKPHMCLDDNPKIRAGGLNVFPPETLELILKHEVN